MLYGANHSPPPPAVPQLAAIARLTAHLPPGRYSWFDAYPTPAPFDALGNGQCGNCVPCSEFQTIAVRRAALGDAWRPTAADTIGLYTALTGFDPATGLPDQGTDTALAMTAWATKGILANGRLDVPHWCTVDPANDAHLAAAIAFTGPLQATMNIAPAAEDPATWSQAPGSGPEWDTSVGGHRICVGGYDGRTRLVLSWGQVFEMHPDFWAKYVMATDCTLSREILGVTGVSLLGLDWDALLGVQKALAA